MATLSWALDKKLMPDYLPFKCPKMEKSSGFKSGLHGGHELTRGPNDDCFRQLFS